jgi:hypothetical protein
MPHHELDYRAIRQQAEIKLQREKFKTKVIFFASSAFMFVFFTIAAWGAYLTHGGGLPQ